jgi:hypothetical protein
MSTWVQSHWLERKVGARGPRWAQIRAGLVNTLPIVINGQPLGLDDGALDDLARTHRFDELAAHFPTRGDASALKRIARFGSQILAIACAAAGLGAEFPLLVEGALFNIAIALFDTVVDEQPYRQPGLLYCVNPSRIRSHLLLGVPLPPSSDPGVELIVSLFRTLFESIRNRVSPTDLPPLAECLTDMYNAEVRQPSAAMAAKYLPTVFLGHLVAFNNLWAAAIMSQLGAFIALLDDWQDLASDIVERRSNSLLGGERAKDRLRYSALCVWRILGGRVSHTEISIRLATELHQVLAVARQVNTACAAAVATFLGDLLDANRS